MPSARDDCTRGTVARAIMKGGSWVNVLVQGWLSKTRDCESLLRAITFRLDKKEFAKKRKIVCYAVLAYDRDNHQA